MRAELVAHVEPRREAALEAVALLDALQAWARRRRGCRTLAMDGETVEESDARRPQVVELWLAGDSLPLYAHRLAIDTLPQRRHLG